MAPSWRSSRSTHNGGAFGVDILPFNDDGAFLAAAVDDNANTLTTWTVRSR